MNDIIVAVQSVKLEDIKPASLISYDGHYYIKSSEVETDEKHVVKSICCDVLTGELRRIDLRQNCDVYELQILSRGE